MARLIHLQLLTDFFNKIGPKLTSESGMWMSASGRRSRHQTSEPRLLFVTLVV